VEFDQFPGKLSVEIEALNRVEAYSKAHQHFTNLGFDVFVSRISESDKKPLDFTDVELQAISNLEVPVRTDIQNGVRIEKIVEQP